MSGEDRLEVAQRAIRGRLADATEENGEAIIATFLAAMKAEKKVSTLITCKKCGDTRSYPVVVPDARAAAAAVDIFLTQSHGRPGVDTAVEAEGEKIVFHRTLVYEGADASGASVSLESALDRCTNATSVDEVREWLLDLQASLNRNGAAA